MTQDWVEASKCDRRLFRDMLGSFMTGVTVVATRAADGSVRAFTANSFTSVSLDPPLVLVCLAKSSGSLDVFTQAEGFSVSVLGAGQRNVSNGFAACDPAVKAAALARLADGPVPYVENCLATMLCDRERVIDAGDHVILLGAVGHFQSAGGQPLGYFRGAYVGFGLAVGELEQLGAPLVVGGLLERDGKVVLCRRPGASDWELPSRPLASGERHGVVLRDLFARLGIAAEASLLYSLFQEDGERRTTMIFSVETDAEIASKTLADGTRVESFGVEARPWEMIEGEMKRGMVQRFFRERDAGCFGIYYDTAEGGRVAALDGKPRPWADWHPDFPVKPTATRIA
ncbi:flavin reductase family protein [Rhizobium sp. YJ-22]|uniref:flavin reductase family protein n=1 Tax=Rhizobium sp. YJ-22 TaxID=3037556 RepID=UPI0024121AEF|nr:flavin reductase family protein [Rhizobium sp. YJ-22]MDG3578025.1 flavin reductase family protein [Rhizobium sp. YJ-22]